MTADFSAAYNYTDLTGLGALKAQAREQSPEALRETANQFEALFVQMMLKSMRDAASVDGEEGGLLDNDQTRFYQELFDKQIALKLSQGRGIGLSDVIYRQLGGEPGAVATTASVAMAPPGFSTHLAVTAAAATPAPIAAVTPAPVADWQPESPRAFVDDLWPHAERAARALGVTPDVLIAQAALESGWGRHQIRHGNDAPSFNLFGIKADHRWDGERVTVSTLEFEDGIATRQRAEFRAYPDLAAAFDDYVAFVTGNPRYADALAQAPDKQGYVTGLADAGYATDPDYATKILSILQRPEFEAVIAGLKVSDQAPIT